MNNIEILEKLIERYDTPCGMHINPIELWEDERDAIENLINRVKELEDEVEKQKAIINFLAGKKLKEQVNHAKEIEINFNKLWVSKDKIKEKIELIKNLNEKIYYEENVISILQDLLEEEE